MGLTPLTFSGISQYSSDFQTILERVTTIASFPLTQLKNEQTDVAAKRQLTNELNTSVKLLGERLTALKDIAANRGVSATSSNTAKLTVDTVNTGTLTQYNLTEVSSTARSASETSVATFASSATTTVSTTGVMRLTVGSQNYDLNLPSGQNNLVGLRNKINSLNAGVTATILTVDGSTNVLSVTANTTGARTLSLRDDPAGANTNFLTAANQGSNLNFKLNGVSVSRASNQVNDLIPGVSFTVRETTAANETLTINLTSDRSKLSDAISDFVDAYNAVQEKVTAQVGKTAGLLSGDYLVREAQDIMRRISSFGLANGTVKNWSDFGVDFAASGAISFDVTKFNSLSVTVLQDSFAFFADTTGLGQLSKTTAAFSADVTGLAALQIAQYDRTDIRLDEQILVLEERINLILQNYLQKLQAADALLGAFESQQRVITASVDSLNLVLYGKQEG